MFRDRVDHEAPLPGTPVGAEERRRAGEEPFDVAGAGRRAFEGGQPGADEVSGYACCPTDTQDLTAQRNALTALGVKPDQIYTDYGLTGTNRARPGLREALAACRCGDTLVVTKLDRLARSLPDARDIVAELTGAGVKLNIGGSVRDPDGPFGRLLSTSWP